MAVANGRRRFDHGLAHRINGMIEGTIIALGSPTLQAEHDP
jgi:hypothetical protein